MYKNQELFLCSRSARQQHRTVFRMILSDFELLMLALGAMGFGTVMLVYGGNWTIDGAVYTARKFGVSSLLIGFTVIAFGTSLPELLVSVNANLKGYAGISLGNVLGSNIANVLLVVGTAALLTTIQVAWKPIRNDIFMMLFATALMIVAFLSGVVTPWMGIGFVGVLVAYVIYTYSIALRGEPVNIEEPDEPEFQSDWMAYLFLVLGLILVAAGAEFLVRGAKISAEILGVPDAVIALSLIAIGTSLPELATCIAAVMKKNTDIIIGNIVGSNVFNILMIIGVTATIKEIPVAEQAPELVRFDMWITLAVTLFFAAWLAAFKRVPRPLGGIFLLAYASYMLLIYNYNTI